MLIKSPVYSAAAGSVAGLTYQTSRSGAMVRARRTPTRPTSDATAYHRASLVALTERWSNTLTRQQRESWTTYASAIAYPGALGDPIQLSGLAHYLRSNLIRSKCSLPLVDLAPAAQNLGEPPIILAVIASWSFPGIIAEFDASQAWHSQPGAYLYGYATNPVSPTCNRRRTHFRLCRTAYPGSIPPPGSPAAFNLNMGPESTNRVWTAYRISYADGRLSPLTIAGPHTLEQ